MGAEAYLECSAFTSEKSINSVFRSAALACLDKLRTPIKPSPTHRKRLLHLPSKRELLSCSFSKERTKSCSVMWSSFTASCYSSTAFKTRGRDLCCTLPSLHNQCFAVSVSPSHFFITENGSTILILRFLLNCLITFNPHEPQSLFLFMARIYWRAESSMHYICNKNSSCTGIPDV